MACTYPEDLRQAGSLTVLQEAVHSPALARQQPELHAQAAELWGGLLGTPHTAPLLLHLASQAPSLGPVLSELQDPARLQVIAQAEAVRIQLVSESRAEPWLMAGRDPVENPHCARILLSQFRSSLVLQQTRVCSIVHFYSAHPGMPLILS